MYKQQHNTGAGIIVVLPCWCNIQWKKKKKTLLFKPPPFWSYKYDNEALLSLKCKGIQRVCEDVQLPRGHFILKMWIHFQVPNLFSTRLQEQEIKTHTFLTSGEFKCRCCRVEGLFFFNFFFIIILFFPQSACWTFGKLLVLFPRRELQQASTHSLSSLSCGQCIFLSSALQNTVFFVVVVFFPHTAPKQTHVDLFYGLGFLLREDCALLLSFSESTLQRTETVLYCCCCCRRRRRWAFQPYAALSHIIPLWVWWWHWCGLLLLGSLPCISHEDLFFF